MLEGVGVNDVQAPAAAELRHVGVGIDACGGDPFVGEQAEQLAATAPDVEDRFVAAQEVDVVPLERLHVFLGAAEGVGERSVTGQLLARATVSGDDSDAGFVPRRERGVGRHVGQRPMLGKVLHQRGRLVGERSVPGLEPVQPLLCRAGLTTGAAEGGECLGVRRHLVALQFRADLAQPPVGRLDGLQETFVRLFLELGAERLLRGAPQRSHNAVASRRVRTRCDVAARAVQVQRRDLRNHEAAVPTLDEQRVDAP